MRNDFTKSNAVEESRPRVVLSQQHIEPREIIISAIETRLRSPPETPRIRSLPPRRVFLVCSILYIFKRVLMTSFLNWSLDSPGSLFLGILVSRAKSRVWPTVSVGRCVSSVISDVYENNTFLIVNCFSTI